MHHRLRATGFCADHEGENGIGAVKRDCAEKKRKIKTGFFMPG